MGELSAESFADWLHPSDVIDHYISLGQDEAKAKTIAMLCDGLLQAAAGQFIVDGKDCGLTLIPREFWRAVSKTDVWSTGRFQVPVQKDSGDRRIVSGYDVRIDRDIRKLPKPEPKGESGETPPAPEDHPSKPNRATISHAAFCQWFELFALAYPGGSIEQAWASAKGMFPDKRVTRDQVRALMPDRPKGRPRKSKGIS